MGVAAGVNCGCGCCVKCGCAGMKCGCVGMKCGCGCSMSSDSGTPGKGGH